LGREERGEDLRAYLVVEEELNEASFDKIVALSGGESFGERLDAGLEN